MVTRYRVGTNRPTQRYTLSVSTISPIPKSYNHAFQDPHWYRAMLDEYNALIKNNTWILVPRPSDANIVRSLWLFRHKYNADGTLNRYKACLVANGSTQLTGIDVDETFSPIVKPATIRMVLSLALSRHWPIHQLDVKNAFLHGSLSETVYMQQPPGFRDSQHPDHVCLLQRSLYGLKQAPRAWFQRFAAYAARVGFIHSRCDTSLFIYRRGSDTAYLLLYVDDIILTASSTAFLQSIIATLHAEFSMTDLGPLNYFLGISVTRNTSGMFLSQQKYASELLERAGMLTCNPCRTPVDTDSKLSADGDPVSDPTLYRSLAGALQYLTFTRPDISYAVQQVCLYMHDPREPHFSALKRILRYIRGTMPYGLQLFSSTTSSLVAYSDADWAGCPTTRRSTSGYCVFLGNNLLSWSSKRQVTLSRSSAEAEYRGVANAVAETCWLRNLLRELHTPLSTATLVYCDNVSAVYLSSNPVQHQRTKHIEIDIHFVRDLVAAGHIRVLHVPSRYQYADVFTKGLPTVLFDEFRSSLSVRSSPAQTAGGSVRQAQLVDIDTESDPEEAPSEAEESQPLGSKVPLVGEEFEAFEPSGTRTDSSHSSASLDSTTPLSSDHPLTYFSPTPTPTRASFHHRTARITVHAQPAMSPGQSTRVVEAMASSDPTFRKRHRSSYETPSPSLTLPVWKRYRGTSELILDTDSEGDKLGDEDGEDESLDADDEREEEEVVPEGQQQTVLVVETTASEPLGLGYGVLRRHELAVEEHQVPNTFEAGQISRSMLEQEGAERVYAFRQPTLTTWVDPKDDRVYTDILTYPPVASVQTPPSPEWSSGSLPISPSSPARENHDLRMQLAEERRERLELADRVARMERRQEPREE
ncbi:ribonuclease H-like domain-containing protein [Tanacetum coccineum]|uniref:Ribonuclease H-like domain-containing protein n=1 Tax=Tanacetum coccineum TaxID=301880 RepID=A0ABQ5JFZ0_9ASTR